MPENPRKGKWLCDVMANGQTVCMLQCQVIEHKMFIALHHMYKRKDIQSRV